MKIIVGFLCLLFLLISVSLTAQTVIRKGYVVTLASDTIHGWIDYKGWSTNPEKIAFRKDSLSENKIFYTVKDIKYFEVLNLDAYVKTEIIKDVRPILQGDLWPDAMDSVVKDTVFLRMLVKGGMLDLYELVDFKNHYFIRGKDKVYTELTYRWSRRDGTNNSIQVYHGYRKQLSDYDNGEQLKAKIARVQYNEDDLKNIVMLLNSNRAEQYYTLPATSKNKLFNWFAGGGTGIGTLSFSGTYGPFKNMKYSSSPVVYLTSGFDMHTSRKLQSVFIRLEVSLSMLTYKGTGDIVAAEHPTKSRYLLNQINISPGLSGLYHFVRKDRLKMYLGAGGSLNFSFYGKNEYGQSVANLEWFTVQNYLSLNSLWPSFNLRTGAIFNKKLEFGVVLKGLGVATEEPDFELYPRILLFNINFHF